MSFRIRRGTEAQRAAAAAFDLGEPVWTTDKQQLYIGDGVTPGGIPLIRLGTGLAWATINNIPYITATGGGGGGGGGGITAIVQDANPTLGGNLALSGHNINGTGNIAIGGTISSVGTATFTGGLGGNLATNGYNITGTGNISAGNITTTGTANIGGGLGGNLSLNGYNIAGNGFLAMTGGINVNLTADVQLHRVVDGSSSNGYITTTLQRGTLVAPAAVHAGDELGGILMRAYTSNSVSAISGIISFIVDPTAVVAGGTYVKSLIAISAATDTNQDSSNAVLIDSNGLVTSNAFVASKYFQLPVYANDAARTSAISAPTAGTMVFMTSGTSPAVTNKAVIYNGTAWALLPG